MPTHGEIIDSFNNIYYSPTSLINACLQGNQNAYERIKQCWRFFSPAEQAEARKQVNEVLAKSPHDAHALVTQGYLLYYVDKKIDAAVQCFKKSDCAAGWFALFQEKKDLKYLQAAQASIAYNTEKAQQEEERFSIQCGSDYANLPASVVTKIVENYKLSANLGHAVACNKLGTLYQLGARTQPAMEQYQKAALLGLASGIHNLGYICYKKRYLELAKLYFKVSAQAGSKSSLMYIAKLWEQDVEAKYLVERAKFLKAYIQYSESNHRDMPLLEVAGWIQKQADVCDWSQGLLSFIDLLALSYTDKQILLNVLLLPIIIKNYLNDEQNRLSLEEYEICDRLFEIVEWVDAIDDIDGLITNLSEKNRFKLGHLFYEASLSIEKIIDAEQETEAEKIEGMTQYEEKALQFFNSLQGPLADGDEHIIHELLKKKYPDENHESFNINKVFYKLGRISFALKRDKLITKKELEGVTPNGNKQLIYLLQQAVEEPAILAKAAVATVLPPMIPWDLDFMGLLQRGYIEAAQAAFHRRGKENMPPSPRGIEEAHVVQLLKIACVSCDFSLVQHIIFMNKIQNWMLIKTLNEAFQYSIWQEGIVAQPTLRTLLKKYGVSMEVYDENNKTFLYYTLKAGKDDISKNLVKEGYKLTQVRPDGSSFLHDAMRFGRFSFIMDLLNEQKEDNTYPYREELLHALKNLKDADGKIPLDITDQNKVGFLAWIKQSPGKKTIPLVIYCQLTSSGRREKGMLMKNVQSVNTQPVNTQSAENKSPLQKTLHSTW